MHRSTIKVKASSFRDKILDHPLDKIWWKKIYFGPTIPTIYFQSVAMKSTKLRVLLIFFVSLCETMDKDFEVDGTSLLFSESASYEAVFIQ